LRRTVGELAARIEHDDMVRDAHHQAHVVFDHQNRRSEIAADASDRSPSASTSV
jgi:hypothetical protein